MTKVITRGTKPERPPRPTGCSDRRKFAFVSCGKGDQLDPKILASIAQLARIKDYSIGLGRPFQPTPNGLGLQNYAYTLRKNFEIIIRNTVSTAHYAAICNNPATPEAAANISRSARLAITELESSGLSPWFLASDIAAVDDLAKQARFFKFRAKSQAKAAKAFREAFVSQLLDAADDAGGRLTINRLTERGSLVEVIDLLRPYLPAEFRRGLSVANLRRIRSAWLKSRKNN